MKPLVLAFLSIALLFQSARAQQQQQHGFHITQEDDTIQLRWDGQTPFYYFIQYSGDLFSWTFVPSVEIGNNTPIALAFDMNADRGFWRMFGETDPNAPLLAADYNGIGLSAWQQLQLGFNPFDWVDSNSNGMHDAWELFHFQELGVDPNDDEDADGQTNLQEFLSGNNPLHPDHPAVGLALHTPLR
ncbi:MAG: hypothetical protein ACFCU3_03660 [Verrucomicrobiales bacterium]